MKKEYNLLENRITVDNYNVKLESNNLLNNFKEKLLTLVGLVYLYDRITLALSKDVTNIRIAILIVVYGTLLLFVVYLLYKNWIESSWTNSLKVENISKLTLLKDEDNPLNIHVSIKGKFNTLNVTFRETETDLKNFVTQLQNLNSRLIIKDERI